MEEKKVNIKNIQLILHHNMSALKLRAIVLVACCTAAMLTFGLIEFHVARQTEALRCKAAALEQENADYKAKIADLGSVASVEEIAREELGLVRPDTIFIKPE